MVVDFFRRLLQGIILLFVLLAIWVGFTVLFPIVAIFLVFLLVGSFFFEGIKRI